MSRMPSTVVLLALATLFAISGPPRPQAGEAGIWRDEASGLAIGGFDPVAYFIRARPVRGDPTIGVTHAGAGWVFENTGNRAAFARNPEVYAPGFFGYDPVSLAFGKPVAGQPALFAVESGRLYLFATEGNRSLFRQSPVAHLRHARARWPTLRRMLPGVRDR